MKQFKCDVRNHSRRQLELKTQYPLYDNKKSNYSLDLYLFTPGQLNIDSKNYGIKQFLKDYKSNVRYSSPRISLSGLLNLECSLSPLNRIDKKLDELTRRARLDENYILYELRVLTNIYRLEMKSVSDLIIREIKKGDDLFIVKAKIESHLELIEKFLIRLRSFYLDFMIPEISDKLKEALRWADESISMVTEKALLRVYDKTLKYAYMSDIRKSLIETIEYELTYRSKKGFITMLEEDQPLLGETISYRESILKKWSQGAMYMNLERSKTDKKVSNILSGVAASSAMAFAVAATFVAEKLFTNYSTPWIMVAIIIYMFKDRIKDSLKAILFSFMPLFIADKISNLIDPATDEKVGICKTIIRFCTTSSLPHEVKVFRDRMKNPFRSILPKENIIHCKKNITVNGDRLLKKHKRHNSITEITRINIEKWLKDMDDPIERFSTIKDGEKIYIDGSRVYYLNLIVALKEKKDKKDKLQLFHYRLILNRKGLIKVKHLSTN